MVRFLDNVNDYSTAPLPEYLESMQNKRRIGVGIMGWGSALFMLNVPFASERADQIRNEIMQTIAITAYEASIDLAEEKGMFAYCDPEKHLQGRFVSSLGLSEEYETKLLSVGIRNSSLLSIQPTGNCVTEAGVVRTPAGELTMSQLIASVVPDVSVLQEGDIIKLDTPTEIDTFEGKDVFDTVYVNGVQPVINLTIENEVFTQTPDHKYLVKINDEFADWRCAKDLRVGDKIIAI